MTADSIFMYCYWISVIHQTKWTTKQMIPDLTCVTDKEKKISHLKDIQTGFCLSKSPTWQGVKKFDSKIGFSLCWMVCVGPRRGLAIGRGRTTDASGHSEEPGRTGKLTDDAQCATRLASSPSDINTPTCVWSFLCSSENRAASASLLCLRTAMATGTIKRKKKTSLSSLSDSIHVGLLRFVDAHEREKPVVEGFLKWKKTETKWNEDSTEQMTEYRRPCSAAHREHSQKK